MNKEDKLQQLGFKDVNRNKCNRIDYTLINTMLPKPLYGKKVNNSRYILQEIDKQIIIFMDYKDLENEDQLKEVIDTLKKDYEELRKRED